MLPEYGRNPAPYKLLPAAVANAHVKGAKEVRELGEYLTFIQFQAQNMAGPLATPSIYGVSTTNEWVVREFIGDKENNPCIYKGLPLHTEYRVFIDCDKNEIIGFNPYWDPEIMLKRFGHVLRLKLNEC